jgi:hypothetical protein
MAHFTEAQRAQLGERGISEVEANRQLALAASPTVYADVARPCVIGDGIESIPEGRQRELIASHEQAARQGRVSKFVPASGAATRMFQDVITGAGVHSLLAALPSLAFEEDLRSALAARGHDMDVLRAARSGDEVVAALLDADGLGYATIPKALVPFHRYAYARDGDGVCRVHFTVSPEHLHAFRQLAQRVVPVYERLLSARFLLSWSVQKASTDTLAALPGGGPFVADDGRLVLRPSGHGALIENLSECGGDVVFVKNIDNVQTDALREDTVRWKKILCGRLVELQRALFLHVARLRSRPVDAEFAAEAAAFAARELAIEAPADELLGLLERPLRVCGVVLNTGEPGGGPFWVRGRDGRITRQIVETAHVDPSSFEQRAHLRGATHFNPVDLVCGLHDVEGAPFDLTRFLDPDAVMVTKKHHQGRDVLALERPGLWNGAMAGWITIFVEVPNSTFTPVKTVADLLRPEHQ